MALVMYHNRNNILDTVPVYNPDAGGNYSTKINLPLGKNEVKVVAISKNASTVKKVLLTGIDRRLVRIDQSNTNLFQVSKPSSDKNGIGANVFVDVNKIKILDSLIQRVMVLRTDIYAYPVVSTDKTKKMTAQNLGDTGEGFANTPKGSIVNGLTADYNAYRVVDSLVSGNAIKLNSDSTIVHRNDLCYFAYTSAIVDNKVYWTAPVGDVGTYFVNERTIIIDTVSLFTICRHPWGVGDYLFVWNSIQQTTMHIGSDSLSARQNIQTPTLLLHPVNGVPQETKLKPAHELAYGDSIRFTKYGGSTWVRDDAGTWKDNGNLPASVSFLNIVVPSLNAITGWLYSNLKVNTADIGLPALPDLLAYNIQINDGGILGGTYIFDQAFKVYWHYKDNP
jgi:hypothetical protein